MHDDDALEVIHRAQRIAWVASWRLQEHPGRPGFSGDGRVVTSG
ncbi:MAG TPA: hypothetical protein VEC76_07280 [Streptosporangiaceae bacterium]|nr:hypothetical protein [Streptosporangiaceae bacterium]